MKDRDGSTLASRDFVQSLERGLAVIEAFDEQNPRMTLAEVAQRTGLTRAAARRFLLTLVDLGYMRAEGNQFSLRPRVLTLGQAYLSSMTISDIVTPRLRELSEQTGESFSLSTLDGDEIIYISQVTAPRPMAIRIHVGTRFPAYATSMGRVLLAHSPEAWLADYLDRWEPTPFTSRTISSRVELEAALQKARDDGYALVDRELDYSLKAVAIGVLGASGTVEFAMSMSLHSALEDDTATAKGVPMMRAAAEQIASDMMSLHEGQQ
ncbi:IclR family transcriptional regulator [Microbacterium sp. Y-01]|uniref:IclR family transcriptional regulator domain-containing protein n=1 Tax=Microbacterium sp. Y-01 TaxID=2048898 RepID=UPI000F5EC4EF|nr:IclR family transcriptional regulator C-terminal domain-containing protein [Microbacterium sp. Y-01]AZH79025.1 IclR family transcriptional regulator [Microbacterium sp. Y-01]